MGSKELWIKNDTELERHPAARAPRPRSRSTDRYGQSQHLHRGASYARFAGALREYEGWAARLRADFGARSGELREGSPPDRGADRDARRRSSGYFRTGVPSDEPRRGRGRRPATTTARTVGCCSRSTERRTGAVTTVPLPERALRRAGLREPAPRARSGCASWPARRRTRSRWAAARRTAHDASRRCASAILDLAKEGSQLSRFKGLGEMNAEQLCARPPWTQPRARSSR